MQYGEEPCRQTKCPATTADTTAELGCKPWHWAIACECRLIRPAADRGCVFLHCRNHAVTMAHRSGGCHIPWAVSLPYRFNGFPCFLIKLIDKSLSHRHSCRAMAGKHHSDFRREKTRKEAALDACSRTFRVFQNSRLFNSHGLFGLKKLCVEQMGIVVPMSTFSIPKKLTKLGSQLSKSHRRETHL